jgi:anti-anti-sigma regulatory factor
MVKQQVRKEADGSLIASITGKIDEHFDGGEIVSAARGVPRVVLRLEGVRSITSLGVRAFENFLLALDHASVVLDEISAAMANQFSMIPTLSGRTTVRSARLPFVCPACGNESLHAIPYEAGAATAHAPKCPDCRATMEFDGFSEEYLPHGR